MAVELNQREGIVCGRRSNGDRCVLWSDDTFEWFNEGQFAYLFSF